MYVRAVQEAELPTLREIERAAGECFRDVGMPAVADDEPLPLDVLADYRRAGRAWVVADPTPIAYLLADVVDGNVHIEQVSVHPEYARRRVGRRLIDHVADHARALGSPSLTLTTFAEVPWNAPYYLRCGFVVLEQGELTPELRAIVRREAAHGLDRWPRVCMRRPL